ncbi:MAG: RNA polymerase sigma factor [Phycisphaerales bacterium]
MSREQMHSQVDDAALVARARGGDRSALEQLWISNRRWVAAIVLAHRPRNVDVEDLMQQVAVKVISKLDTLRDEGAFKPWLRQIALNACRGAARGLRPTLSLTTSETPERGQTVAPPASGSEHGRAMVDHRDAAARLYRQVESLPSEYAEPLIMRCVQEMSYAQISEILELPITTIETRLARARRMLREEMSGDTLAGDIGGDA